MPKKRAMTSEQASQKKTEGHKREHRFAELIGGEVNRGAQTDKKDVIDKKHRTHSVKGGQWWQIFLYARSRLEQNTIFRGLKGLRDPMVECLDVFPDDRNTYKSNKHEIKKALQAPMEKLARALQENGSLAVFLSKSMFNGGEVNYLSVNRGNGDDFHVFAQEDVVENLSEILEVGNSRGRRQGEYDSQKVIFRVKSGTKALNVGEIEIRTDSDLHYKQIKCRFNGEKILRELKRMSKEVDKKIEDRLFVYDKAIRSFKI